MTTALVTRPREDSEGVSRELRARGLEVAVEPLLDIHPLDAAVDAQGVQGILATSANGVRTLARVLPDRSLPVWAVGDASARAARELGYERVESAGGNVETLAALVRQRCTPEAGAFLHAAGSVTAGDLSGRLGEAGFTVRRVVLYEARPATEISADLAKSLGDGALDVALFFSPRTAATFVTLVKAAGLAASTGKLTAYALSSAVAAELATLPWATVRVAAAPTQAALLAALEDDLAAGRIASADPRTSMTDTEQTPPAPAQTVLAQTTPENASEPSTDAEIAEPAIETETAKGRGWVPVAAAVLVATLAAVAALVWSELRPGADVPTPQAPVAAAPPPANAAVVSELQGELAATRERLRALEARLAQQPQAADLTPMENRLGQTEAAVKALQAQPQVPAKLVDEVDSLSKQVADLRRTSADAAAVLRLADRVEKAETSLRDMQARRASAAALLLAVGQLRESLAAAMPFDAELRAVKALAGQDAEIAPAIETLKPRAAVGIPTLPVLTARLSTQASAIIRAQVLPEQQGWWRQTLDRMASLVTIEREDGNTAGTSPAAIVARAQTALAVGDLAQAIAEMDTLSGGPAEQAAPWLADAKARLAAGKAVSDMTAHVVAAIGAGQ
ncbi:MAG TPA: uroporphyrinogen-III synthase [Magnetospirillum sp.]|nr:uroporphyrinogen-III synthase [Magnetospirillum sp.]